MMKIYQILAKFGKKLVEMVGKKEKNPQLNMFQVPLKQFINESHELVELSKKIDWESLEKDLRFYYCEDNGRPGVPIRLIVGIIMLRRMFNQSDESVLDRWVENPYWQYFCGEVYFRHDYPFDRTELIKFRQRIGEKGAEQILKATVNLFEKKEVQEKEVLIDTTVQEKNITFPTDVKLQKKIIEQCRKISKSEGIRLRQTYKGELKQLMIDQRFHDHPRRKKKALSARRRIKVIAGKVFRDLERKMTEEGRLKYKNKFTIFNRVLTQNKNSKNKVYSLHQPQVSCIAKGKEHKKYEFGNKVSIAKTRKSGIIIGVMSFAGNPFDGDTLAPQLAQVERIAGYKPETGIVDRGYRGRKQISGTQIICPGKPSKTDRKYQRQKMRQRFRARAGIEPVIGHVKHDHRMLRNYLLDHIGDTMNSILAAAGFNLRKMLRRLKSDAKLVFEIFENFILTLRRNLIFLLFRKMGVFHV
ncbi:MAG: IS5 family transposase [Chitinophagales bacterium]|nr:IS5 family transposase [Chitinophagales bacterium]